MSPYDPTIERALAAAAKAAKKYRNALRQLAKWMAELRWLDRVVVDAMHLDQIREHGGRAGLRGENALEAACARPRQKRHYEPTSDLPTLAAAYSRSHPYQDGNKRTAFLAMVVFLDLNGWSFRAEEDEVVTAMVGLAAGGLSEEALASWLRDH